MAVVLVATGCVDDGPHAVAPDVDVRAAGCSLVDRLASGIVVADGYVLTAAHVVRGASTVTVDGTPGVVVAVDPRIDGALIAVATSGPAAVATTSVATRRATIDAQAVVIERRVVASIDEPMDDETYRRRALVLDGRVAHGDSGSGVFGPDGGLLGMVFAVSTRQAAVAYAVASSELRPFIEQHAGATHAVDVGSCR